MERDGWEFWFGFFWRFLKLLGGFRLGGFGKGMEALGRVGGVVGVGVGKGKEVWFFKRERKRFLKRDVSLV